MSPEYPTLAYLSIHSLIKSDMKNSLLTLFTLTALLLAGCKKDDPGGSGGVDIPVTDVTINHDYILLNLADSEGGG